MHFDRESLLNHRPQGLQELLEGDALRPVRRCLVDVMLVVILDLSNASSGESVSENPTKPHAVCAASCARDGWPLEMAAFVIGTVGMLAAAVTLP